MPCGSCEGSIGAPGWRYEGSESCHCSSRNSRCCTIRMTSFGGWERVFRADSCVNILEHTLQSLIIEVKRPISTVLPSAATVGTSHVIISSSRVCKGGWVQHVIAYCEWRYIPVLVLTDMPSELNNNKLPKIASFDVGFQDHSRPYYHLDDGALLIVREARR